MKPGSSDPSREEHPFNFIYEKLVSSPTDIVGMIAYSLYKREKLEYIREFKKRNGKDPEAADLQSFHLATNTESRLNGYGVQAKEIAREFLEISLDTKVSEIESNLLADYESTQIGSGLRQLQKFWPSVFQGLVSSWLFTFSIGLVILLSALIRLGPKDVFVEAGRLFGLEIKGSQPSTDTVDRLQK